MNRRSTLESLSLGVLGCALPTYHGRALAQSPLVRATKGQLIKPPRTKLLNGKTIDSAYWQNKVLVVQRWASWCPFCDRQNPNLNALHLEQRDKGLEVLALSVDKDATAASRYLSKKGYQFHAAMMTPEWHQALGAFKTLPEIWVVGRDGLLKDYTPGEMFPEDVEDMAKWLKI